MRQMRGLMKMAQYIMLLICIIASTALTSCNSRHVPERPDTTRPGIVGTYPANNATAVSINTRITVTFSEAMDASSIKDTTFFLQKAATSTAPTTTVGGTITYNPSNYVATFTTQTALEHDAIYGAVVTADIKDTAGNPLTASYGWVFATIPAPGALDATFGSGGRARTSLSAGDDIMYASAIQPDGKILTAGYSAATTLPTTTTFFTIARFQTNGALDTTFNPPSTNWINDYHTGRVYAVIVQSDGKIVAGGFAGARFGDTGHALLARFNTEGTRDTSYGSRTAPDDGSSILNMGGLTQDYIRSLAVQSDGQIVAAADATDDNGGVFRFAIARVTTSGILDSTFGTNGIVVNTHYTSAHAYLLKIQPNGMILVGGTFKTVAENASGLVSSYLMRYDSSGVLDPAFGSGGIVTASTGTNTLISAMEILPSGKIIIAGQTSNTTDDLFLMRFNADGLPDTSFGVNGVTITDDANHGIQHAVGMAVQTDGKILVGATFRPTAGSGSSNSDFSLFRYSEDGTLDTGFGSGRTGISVTDFGSNGDFVESIQLQQDGRIVLIGASYNGTSYDVGMARYWP